MTAATRKQRERDKRRAAGLVRFEAWIPADKADEVRAAVDWISAGRPVRYPIHLTRDESAPSFIVLDADRIPLTDD